jgi:rod shape-determining protein MreD
MSLGRAAILTAVLTAAVILQVSVVPLATTGAVVPNFCLVFVVAVGLARGAAFAMPLAFVTGLALDLAPTADHVVGRWALALVLAGYVAGRVRQDTRPSIAAMVSTVAVGSVVASTAFALSGLALGDLDVDVPVLIRTLFTSLVWDVLLTPLVIPVVRRLLIARETRPVLL